MMYIDPIDFAAWMVLAAIVGVVTMAVAMAMVDRVRVKPVGKDEDG